MWACLRARKCLDAEGRDSAERITAALALSGHERVLDFGCGVGYVAQYLAPRVAEVHIWDVSPEVLERAAARLAHIPQVRVVRLERETPHSVTYDVIVVNSVIQYLSFDELAIWLRRWAAMLAPHGRIALTDIPTTSPSVARETLEVMVFSARRNVLLDTLARAFTDLGSYVHARRVRPLLVVDEGTLERLVVAVGLRLRFLSHNLTLRSRRRSALLQLAPQTAVDRDLEVAQHRE